MASTPGEYMRDYRARNPGYKARDRQLENIRNKAHRVMAQRHPAEFRRIVEMLCREEGIEPPRES